MRTFKLLNSVKKTDNQVKIDRLVAQGYEEVIEVKEEEVKEEEIKQEDIKNDKQEVNLEELELAELKELADERGIEYAKNANAEKMIELLGE